MGEQSFVGEKSVDRKGGGDERLLRGEGVKLERVGRCGVSARVSVAQSNEESVETDEAKEPRPASEEQIRSV